MLPDVVEAILPNENTSVWDLLHYELPPIAEAPLDMPFDTADAVENCSDKPSHNHLSFIHHPVAPSTFRLDLQKIIDQSNEGKYLSLRIPWFTDDLGRPGVWIINYWHQVEHLRWLQKGWNRTYNWLLRQQTADTAIPNAHAIYDEAIGCLKLLCCDEPLQGFQHDDPLQLVANTLLSNEWLNTWTVENCFDVLQARINQADPPNSSCRILTMGLKASLCNAYVNAKYKKREYKPPKVARTLKSWVADGTNELLFIQNINQNHWVSGKIDFRGRTIQIGDSLRIFRGVHAAIEHIQAWLEHDFGERFDLNFKLECGNQVDGTSCGVYAMNSVASYMLGDPILAHNARNLARTTLFLGTMKQHLLTVSSIRVMYKFLTTLTKYQCKRPGTIASDAIELCPTSRANSAPAIDISSDSGVDDALDCCSSDSSSGEEGGQEETNRQSSSDLELDLRLHLGSDAHMPNQDQKPQVPRVQSH